MYLGGYQSAGWKVPVINTGSAAISRGCVVSLRPDADMVIGSIDLAMSQGYGPNKVYLIPVWDWVVSIQDRQFGVAENNIAVGKSGIVTIAGLVWVRTDGAVVADDELKVSTGGILIPHGGAGVKVGRAIMTDITDTTVLDYGTASNTFTLAYINLGGGAVAAYPDDGS